MNKRIVCVALLAFGIGLTAVPAFAHHHHRESSGRESRAERSPGDGGWVLERAERSAAAYESREMNANRVERAFRDYTGPTSGVRDAGQQVDAGERAARNMETGRQIREENDRQERERERRDRRD